VGELRREVREWLHRVSPGGAAAIAAGLVVLVFAADLRLGPGVELTLLYALPIGLATFYSGLPVACGLAVLASLGSLEANVLARPAAPPLPPLAPAALAWNAVQELGVFLLLAVTLDAFKKRLLLEQRAARTDPITAMPNRRAFVEAGELELERARRNGRPLSLVYLDCDDFKAVNDRLGHAGGDAVLAAVGAALREAVRANDSVARLGGDEFGVLLPELDGAGAAALAARLRSRLRASLAARGQGVTFSMGVVTFLAPPAGVEEMIALADGLMYQVKRAGKDGWRASVVPAAPPPEPPARAPGDATAAPRPGAAPGAAAPGTAP
jgi:diguanylate cyclase (GGDEF)-like protein